MISTLVITKSTFIHPRNLDTKRLITLSAHPHPEALTIFQSPHEASNAHYRDGNVRTPQHARFTTTSTQNPFPCHIRHDDYLHPVANNKYRNGPAGFSQTASQEYSYTATEESEKTASDPRSIKHFRGRVQQKSYSHGSGAGAYRPRHQHD